MDYSDLPLLIPVSALADYYQCSICMCDLKNTTFTPCGHRFCEHCINDWLNIEQDCPCCKAHLTTANLFKDHQFDCLIETIEAEKEKSAKKYFESLINAATTSGGEDGQSDGKLISLEQTLTTTADPSVSAKLSDGSAFVGKSLGDMDVVSSTVVNVPSDCITGSTFLPDGRLVLADHRREKLLLLDKDLKLTSELQLPSGPWDVAVVGNTSVIVTLPYKEKLIYVNVSVKPRTGRSISIGRFCYGVVVVDGDIYVSVYDTYGPSAVLVLDRGGEIRKTFGVDGLGKCPRPNYISVSAHGILYVSDSDGGISCYGRTGLELYHVNHENMKWPRGILVDRDGHLLVCSKKSRDIHVLKPDGALDRVFLTSRDCPARPYSLTYRNTDDTLIVTMYDSRPAARAYKLQ